MSLRRPYETRVAALHSEDVHTGFDLMCKGYATKYVPVILAKGLCPHTLQTFFNQQHRWCSGSMSLLFSHKFWHERIGLRRRLTFLSGMSYFSIRAWRSSSPRCRRC